MHCATCTVQHCTHNPKIHFPPALLPALCPAARHVRSAISKARHGSTAGQRQHQAAAGNTGSWQCSAPLSAQRARSCCFASAWQGHEPSVAIVVHGAGMSAALLHCAWVLWSGRALPACCSGMMACACLITGRMCQETNQGNLRIRKETRCHIHSGTAKVTDP